MREVEFLKTKRNIAALIAISVSHCRAQAETVVKCVGMAQPTPEHFALEFGSI